jgi:large subunit ribosomal protein L3
LTLEKKYPMVKALIGKKLGMTQIFDEDGRLVPVTVLQVGPCSVTQVKTADNDNAPAVQIGFGERKRKNTVRPQAGHFRKAGVNPPLMLRDVAPDSTDMPELGQRLGVEVFEGESHVDVVATSKGKGFAGVVKRHGFKGAPASHGGRFGRRAGSIGAGTSPGRVVRGQKMAGHMGAGRVTVRNLRVVSLDPERNLMLVRGSVPGPTGGCLMVRKAVLSPSAKRGSGAAAGQAG